MSGGRWQVRWRLHAWFWEWAGVSLGMAFSYQKEEKDMRNTVQEGFPLDGSGDKPLLWFTHHSYCFWYSKPWNIPSRFCLAGWAKPKHMNEPRRINSAHPTLILETSSLLLPWRDPRSCICFNGSERGIMVTSQPCGLGMTVGRESHSLWLWGEHFKIHISTLYLAKECYRSSLLGWTGFSQAREAFSSGRWLTSHGRTTASREHSGVKCPDTVSQLVLPFWTAFAGTWTALSSPSRSMVNWGSYSGWKSYCSSSTPNVAMWTLLAHPACKTVTPLTFLWEMWEADSLQPVAG